MTAKEAKSCRNTVELLRRLAYNIHGVMDVIDEENCQKIFALLDRIAEDDSAMEPLTEITNLLRDMNAENIAAHSTPESLDSWLKSWRGAVRLRISRADRINRALTELARRNRE